MGNSQEANTEYEEIEISQELYDELTIQAKKFGYTEEEFVNDALRTFLLLSWDERSEALREPGRAP